MKLGEMTIEQLFKIYKSHKCNECPMIKLGICSSYYEEPDCGPDNGERFNGICLSLNEKKLKEEVYGKKKDIRN
jgi:hypothetical protein